MKKIIIFFVSIPLFVLFVAVLKFNFSDSDIFVKNKDGEYVPISEVQDDDFETQIEGDGEAVSLDENVGNISTDNAVEEKTELDTEDKTNSENINTTEKTNTASGIKKLKVPTGDKIYFGAFPDFGGPEDKVTKQRILDFEKLAGRKIHWAYFSQNWFNGIKYPKSAIHTINDMDVMPFVRLMPRSDEEQYKKEQVFSLTNIINGKFDKELRQWALEAKEDAIPLLVDFAVEMNGNWFPWSGLYNGKGITNLYGDTKYPDGPERYRDAYRHIINIFREVGVNNVTWFFHVDIYSNPDEWWNQPKYYYPGDDYIDWVGVSVYGPQNSKEDYWDTFSYILKERYTSILDISKKRPLALLEFGVSDDNPFGNKSEWLSDAFETILSKKYLNFKAISYWHENWEEENGAWAMIRIDSSKEALNTFKKYSSDTRFVPKAYIDSDTHTETQESISWYKPKPGISWQWQLTGGINTDYDVDLYDVDLEEVSIDTVKELHEKGSKVICYFNAGAYEPYRSDSKNFPKEVLGKVMEGWEDEKWLDVSNYEKFSQIMQSRLNTAVNKKCDGVEPDNIQAYTEDTGFNITYTDQLKYNKWLADEAHKRGLAIALKNDVEQVDDLVNDFDFAVVEECFEYDECTPFTKFTKNNKAVLGVEYNLELNDFCDKAKKLNFSWLKMSMDLDGGREACD